MMRSTLRGAGIPACLGPHKIAAAAVLVLTLALSVPAAEPAPLEGTQPLTLRPDIPAQMRAGIARFLARETDRSVADRAKHWNRDCASREAYEKSVAPNRERFRKMIGVVDARLPVKELELVAGTTTPSKLGETDAYTVFAVRWPVLEGVYGEGLLLEPKGGTVKANVVALPDAEQTPEMIAGLTEGLAKESQFARRLAESGCRVVVPVLIDRTDDWSGTPHIWMTNKPHREWVYCAAFDLGRHVIGYEVQKVLSLVDWFTTEATSKTMPVAVAGYGEGALLALYATAADLRVDAALVSGYFAPRQNLADEPLYRNVFGLLAQFGDAEIASLIAPRALVIEHAEAPKVDGPPAAREGRRAWAAPGAIRTPAAADVRAEVARLKSLFPADAAVGAAVELVVGLNDTATGPGSNAALDAFAKPLEFELETPVRAAAVTSTLPDARTRQHRQVTELIDHTQMLLQRSERARAEFWKDADPKSFETWQASTKKYRDLFWDEVIGRFPSATEPMNPRTREVIDDPKFTAYEVTLDVWPDVFCFGMLLVPKDIKPDERRPVVVCQHGLEGEPNDVVTRDTNTQGWKYYHAFAARLAERGFVTYAPHNFYRGGNEFRQLQRKLYPLKKTMYSVILPQHQRHLEWLGTLPFVDAKRIGFYGLSYGGFTAIRVPPLLDGYCLSISSGEFNDMARKKVSTRDVYSYPFYPGYEIFEWNLANTFNYGDLAGFMVPRPFMVERGHDDGVAPDEWVASEYAKVRRRYNKLGIGDKTEIEFFDGGHEIHAEGTFKFLHKHLNWPEPK